MNEFEDFDPGAWLDETSVLLHAPVLRARRVARAVMSTLGVVCFGVAAAFASADTHSVQTSLSIGRDLMASHALEPPQIKAVDLSSMFATHDLDSTWSAALALLEQRGANISALLENGAQNIREYHSSELVFPVEFPADEC